MMFDPGVHIASRATSVHHRDGRRDRRRGKRNRHFRNGVRLAVIRAVTGGKFYLNGTFPTLAAAAIACGSNTHYVTAAAILVKSENSALLDRVLCGAMPLLAAAREAKRMANLVSAYRAASTDDLAGFARAVGPADVWDRVIDPVI